MNKCNFVCFAFETRFVFLALGTLKLALNSEILLLPLTAWIKGVKNHCPTIAINVILKQEFLHPQVECMHT